MSPGLNSGARVLALVTDAWGGTGGIAQYDRDFLEDVAARPDVYEVVVIPRVIARDVQPLPKKVRHITSPAGSKARFVRSALAAAMDKPDLIICGHINLLPVASLASKLAGAPLMLLTYGIEVWSPRGAVWRHLVRSCKAIVSISEFTLGKLRAWARLDDVGTFLVPNAIDLSGYTPGPRDEALRARLGIGNGPLLLTLGRMDASEQAKGFDEVLEALPWLVQQYPGIQYCAAGDGSDRPRLEGKAQSLGVSGRVLFPGYIAEEEKAALYRLADVYVMPSRLEGFGYVFLEAVACGVPVIASRVDGSREAVRDGALGILVDPSDRRELISAIESALVSPFVPSRSELEYFSIEMFSRRGSAAVDWCLGATRRDSTYFR